DAAELHRVATRREAGHGDARARSDILARPAVEAEGITAGRVRARCGRTDCQAAGERLARDGEACLGGAAGGDGDGLGRSTAHAADRKSVVEVKRVATR